MSATRKKLRFKVGDEVISSNCAFLEIRKIDKVLEYSYWDYFIGALGYRDHELDFAPIVAESPDAVNPNHYKTGGIELIDVMFAKMGTSSTRDYMWGCIIKYIFRFKQKNGIEDLKKAQWYLTKLIDNMEGKDNVSS